MSENLIDLIDVLPEPPVETAVEFEAVSEPLVEEALSEPLAEVEEATSEPLAEVEEALSEPLVEVEEALSEPLVEVEEATSEPLAEVEEATSEPLAEVEEATSEPLAEVEEATSEPLVEVEEALSEPLAEVEEATSEPLVEVEEALPEIPSNVETIESVKEPIVYVLEALSVPEHNVGNEPIVKRIETTVLNKPALISQLLIDILVRDDDIKGFADKITLKVSNKTLVILKTILNKAPDALDKVVENVTDILSDGVIDHKDIPKMIILVSNLYKTDLKSVISSQALTTTELVQFIQFVLKLVIDLDFVHVKDKVQIFEIVEASGALLEMIIPPQEIKCPGFLSCLPCFKRRVE